MRRTNSNRYFRYILQCYSATYLATQQSIKAYVDGEIASRETSTSTQDLDYKMHILVVLIAYGSCSRQFTFWRWSRESLSSAGKIRFIHDSTVTTLNDSQTLTNKTLTEPVLTKPVLNTEVTGSAIKNEDDMGSNSEKYLATQKSIKAYVDSEVSKVPQNLDFVGDTGGSQSINLDSETLTFTGGTGIDTSGSGNTMTFAVDSTVTTSTGTQTLLNKTLTSTVLNTVSETAILDKDMAGNSATQLATQQSIKAYVDSAVQGLHIKGPRAATTVVVQ